MPHSADNLQLLAAFAIHAPTDRKWDFDVILDSQRPTPTWANELDKAEGRVPDNQASIRTWERQATAQKAAQWPWRWALACLEAQRLLGLQDPPASTSEAPAQPQGKRKPGRPRKHQPG